ncbi:MAG: hypothetical protein KIT83_02425 [Bryobacterales bacterium]|nr:hypothetical protein [Bryobacterales bacterium]
MGAPSLRGYLRCSLVAGLEVSAIGALAAIALLMALGRFAGMPWYAYGNLFSTVLYSPNVLEAAPGYHTLAGFALVFLYFVASGLAFAVIFPGRRRGAGPYLVAVFFAVALFMAGDRIWWQRISSYIVIYGVHAHLMWAHVVYGVVLGGVARRRTRLEHPPDDAAPPDALSTFA